MTANTPTIIPKRSQEAIVEFCRACTIMLQDQYNLRDNMRNIDLAYIRENDNTSAQWKARVANAYGDSTKFQNVTVPIVMPQVEAAVTYQTSVFLTGSPIFGWVAAPQNQDIALQYQTIMEENSIRGGWVRQFNMFFRDGFKYNLSLMEVSWGRIVTAAVETDLTFKGGREGKPKEVIWEGNICKRWSPYNSFWDTRCAPTEIPEKGEFVGNTELMSRIALKKFINELPDKMAWNIKDAFESGYGGVSTSSGAPLSYYIPEINPLVGMNATLGFDWMSWAGVLERPGNEISYKNLYEVTTIYARIIPQDFLLNVPARSTPQIWKFIIVNYQVLIYAERQTNVHDFLPVFFGQPNEDGLWYQTKSLASNAKPFQEIGSALVNSAMASRRRAISDRGIYNPSLIAAKDINSDSPTAKIPLRPAAYLKNPAEAYYPIPFRDEQSSIAFQELGQIMQFANMASGQNQARQGQFVKGNKTMREFDTVMANANGRDQTTSMLLEAQVFTPLKEVLKKNILQYQAAGSIFSASRKEVVKIDPIALRESFSSYTITDGLTPTEKVISGEDLAISIQTMGSSPQIGAGYNMAPAFSYLMKTRNVNLTPFEKSAQQQAYEQAMGAWQQTCIQLMKQNPEMKQEQFPPQPKPQDYGYVPGQTAGDGQETPSSNQSLTGTPA